MLNLNSTCHRIFSCSLSLYKVIGISIESIEFPYRDIYFELNCVHKKTNFLCFISTITINWIWSTQTLVFDSFSWSHSTVGGLLVSLAAIQQHHYEQNLLKDFWGTAASIFKFHPACLLAFHSKKRVEKFMKSSKKLIMMIT